MNSTSDDALLFDTDHLATYTLGDRQLEKEVLQMFVEQSAQSVERLHEAASIEEWRDAAHSLKGSARAIGAFLFAATAEKLEKVANSLEELDKPSLMILLQSDLEKTKAAIMSHLDNGQ